jgi:hypothetical protein
MTENNESQSEPQSGTRKVSLAEAAKQKLAQKKQAQTDAKGQNSGVGVPKHQQGGAKMKSQNTKKINNMRKKMGV